jgi:hypothetical protein
MARVSTLGQTVENMRESGATTKCMAVEHSNGQMAESTLESTWMTKSKATESSFGQMVEVTREIGLMANNMVKEFTSQVKELRNMESGRKAKG